LVSLESARISSRSSCKVLELEAMAAASAFRR
jgi:hypothetical protein